MKKVFISQPMRGKTQAEILTERNRIIEEIQASIGDHEVLDTYFDDFGPGAKPLQYLAKSLWMLADADSPILRQVGMMPGDAGLNMTVQSITELKS